MYYVFQMKSKGILNVKLSKHALCSIWSNIMELKQWERQQTLRKRLLKSEFMLFENTLLLFYVTQFIKCW